MAFYNYAVGVHKGWITRKQAAERVLKTLRFLKFNCERYHGAWAHWIDGHTGKTLPFSPMDNGADLVETSFLASGFIFLREYFDQNETIETEIRNLSDELWRGIQWNFFSKEIDGKPVLIWHWSPEHEFKINLHIRGPNECHITHLLALVSPTYPISKDHYDHAWLNERFHKKRNIENISL